MFNKETLEALKGGSASFQVVGDEDAGAAAGRRADGALEQEGCIWLEFQKGRTLSRQHSKRWGCRFSHGDGRDQAADSKSSKESKQGKGQDHAKQ